MDVPVLRKTITLPNLSTATIPVRSILTLDERSIDLPATLRFLQCRLNLFLRAKNDPIINLFDTPLHPRLVHRCIHQVWRRTITRSLRSSSLECSSWRSFCSKCLQNRSWIGGIFVARHQSRRLVIQASRRIFHQLLRVLDRPFAIDHITVW
jgi:hypothetical protein